MGVHARSGVRYYCLAHRLIANSVPSEQGDCWLWVGTVTNRYGYIKVWIDGRNRNRLVHRLAYELWRGSIPNGMTIDHKCRETLCINPEHLEPVPNGVNVSRMRAAVSGRHR